MGNRFISSLILLLLSLPPIYGGENVNITQYSADSIDRDTTIYIPENYKKRDSLYFDHEMMDYLSAQHHSQNNLSKPANKPREYEFAFDYMGSAAWGESKDVQVRDNIAYCTFGAGLVILDVSDPNNPQYLSKYYTQVSPEQITLYGDYAYVAGGSGAGGAAMMIFDISDKYNPVKVGQYGEDFAGWKITIDTANSPLVAAVCAGDHGVHFVDISDPANPQFLSHYNLPDARDVLIDGDTAYVIDLQTQLFVVLNVTDYSNFYGYNYFVLPGGPRKLLKKGDYIYVIEEAGHIDDWIPPQIQAIDVSDVYNPTIVATYDSLSMDFCLWDAKIVGDTLFVAMGRLPQVHFYDISDPMQIIWRGFIAGYEDAFELDIADSFLYVTCSSTGMGIFDIGNLDSSYRISNYSCEAGGDCFSGAAYNIKLFDTFAYILNKGAIMPISIADPANPYALGCDNYTNGRDFDVQDDFACIIHGKNSHVRSVDMTNIYDPVTIEYFDTDNKNWDVDISGNYAYIAADSAGIQIYDISNPWDLVHVGYYDDIYVDESHIAGTITIRDNIAFVGDSWGMRALDITDPINPVKIGDFSVSTGQGVRRIVLRGSEAFLALAPSDSLTIVVVDVADPSNMITISEYAHPDHSIYWDDAQDIAISGNYAFVANGFCIGYGLLMIDISDYSNMHVVGVYDTPYDAVVGVKSRGRYVYLTDYYGMIILHVDYPAPCGDINADDSIDIFDITSLINYLYLGGPPSEYPESANVNGDGDLNLFDIVYLITYLYLNGPEPNCP